MLFLSFGEARNYLHIVFADIFIIIASSSAFCHHTYFFMIALKQNVALAINVLYGNCLDDDDDDDANDYDDDEQTWQQHNVLIIQFCLQFFFLRNTCHIFSRLLLQQTVKKFVISNYIFSVFWQTRYKSRSIKLQFDSCLVSWIHMRARDVKCTESSNFGSCEMRTFN